MLGKLTNQLSFIPSPLLPFESPFLLESQFLRQGKANIQALDPQPEFRSLDMCNRHNTRSSELCHCLCEGPFTCVVLGSPNVNVMVLVTESRDR